MARRGRWRSSSGFSDQPIQLVVQSSAGGGSDLFARTLAALVEKEKLLSQPIVVEKKPGGSGMVPFSYVAGKRRNPYSGDLITVEGSASPIMGDADTIVGFLAIQRDISERKRVEEALRKSEASYRELFNSVDNAIYIQDKDGKFLDVNQGAVDMYGYPREYFVGRTPADLGEPGMNNMERTLEAVKRTFAGEPQQFEWWRKRKNGEIFPKVVRLNRSMYFGQEVVVALALGHHRAPGKRTAVD